MELNIFLFISLTNTIKSNNLIQKQQMGSVLGLGQKKQPQKPSLSSQNNENYQNSYSQQPNFYQQQQQRTNPSGQISLLNQKQEDKNKKVVAIIVTFNTGGSYDNLFTTVQQKSMEGTKVQVYSCDSQYLQFLSEAFNGKPKDDVAIKLMNSIKQVDPDCVVFNWECCGGYSGENFPEGNDKLFVFLKKMIDRGHMCMFSDFSLKALVQQWKEKYQLGPNPFVKTGQFTGNFQINFNSGELKQCPSAQLQIVGEMAEGGKCNIHAMGGTIQYCVDNTKLNHNIYKLQVLTVASNLNPPKKDYISKIGKFQGSAGHILLKYPSGGMILTSMGHWIELMKIDTSEQKLFEVAQREYGVNQAARMQEEYMQMDSFSQKNYIETKARQFVRNQAPCTNMYKKSSY